LVHRWRRFELQENCVAELAKMRNLQVFREEAVNLRLENSDEVVVAGAYDSDNGRLFLASSACTLYTLYFDGQDQASTSLLDDKANGSSPASLQEQDKIVSMEFLSEKEVLVLGLAAGDILQFDPSAQEVEVVGNIEGGVVSMVLSPDGELLVVATGLGQLLLMTQDWDVLYEVSVNQPLVGLCLLRTFERISVI
jgi:elongator complex protein 1